MTDSASVSKYEKVTNTALQFHRAQRLTLSFITDRGLKYYIAEIQHKELHQQTLNNSDATVNEFGGERAHEQINNISLTYQFCRRKAKKEVSWGD